LRFDDKRDQTCEIAETIEIALKLLVLPETLALTREYRETERPVKGGSRQGGQSFQRESFPCK